MDIRQDERLTRFIFSKKSGFSIERMDVKYGAFIPPKKSPGEISVYRTSSLTESEVWAIGEEYVKRGDRTIKARADLSAGDVYDIDFINLEVIPDTQPHELHANIVPIPIDREDRDEVLRELACLSKLVIAPE